jgi:hypothetical protein
MRNSVQIAIMKTFSLKAVFLAMFWPSCMSFKNPRWHLEKSLPVKKIWSVYKCVNGVVRIIRVSQQSREF